MFARSRSDILRDNYLKIGRMAFLTSSQLEKYNFKFLGKNVLISDKASFYNCQHIEIGDFSRIDDFCIISGGSDGIVIGKYVHIACYCSLIGKSKIVMEDFSGLSSKVSIYSSSDDYSGLALTNPTVPEKYTNVNHGPVTLSKHVIVGSGSIILPNVHIEEGVAVGALSLVSKNCTAFYIYSGVPAKPIKQRKKNILELEQQLLNEQQS